MNDRDVTPKPFLLPVPRAPKEPMPDEDSGPEQLPRGEATGKRRLVDLDPGPTAKRVASWKVLLGAAVTLILLGASIAGLFSSFATKKQLEALATKEDLAAHVAGEHPGQKRDHDLIIEMHGYVRGIASKLGVPVNESKETP